MSLKDFLQKLIDDDLILDDQLKKTGYRRRNYEGKPKKMALLYILDILREESDAEHPLNKNEIIDILHFSGMDINRKTAYDNINLLQEEGLISSDGRRRGLYYDDWLFDYSELYYLQESVDSSPIIAEKEKTNLKNKIAKLGGKYFDETPAGLIRFKLKEDSSKREYNKQIFLNIAVIKEAIRKGKKIKYDYYEYGLDKKLHKSNSYEVSPYEVFMGNHYYYCKVGDEYKGVLYHRLDMMKNIDITRRKKKSVSEITKYNQPVNIHGLSGIPSSKIEGERVTFKFRADRDLISECMDYFNSRNINFAADEEDDNKMIVTLKTNTTAMESWIRRHLDTVEIIQPLDFKVKMYEFAKAAYEMY